MTKVQPTTNESVKSECEVLREQHLAQTPIDHILQRLSRMELPAKEHFERYMRHKWCLNHKPKTLASSFTSVMLFLGFCGKSGKKDLEGIERVDLEAFIEHEQDRGMHIVHGADESRLHYRFFAFSDGAGYHPRGTS